MRKCTSQVRAQRGFVAFALLLAIVAPVRARAQDTACAFRLETVTALFGAAADADTAVEALAQGDGATATESLAGARERLLAEKRRVADGWRGVLDAREKKQLVKALKTARKRALRAARAAERKPAAAASHAAAALDAIDGALAAQGDARAAAGCADAGEIAVPELTVGEGRTRTVPAGATIVAARGITILGTLAVRGPGGGVELSTLEGGIVIDGTVDARGDPAPAEDASGFAPRAAGARAANDGRPRCGSKGGRLAVLSASSIDIGPRAVLSAGLGANCVAPAMIASWSQLHETNVAGRYGGRHGGDGGDVILAPNVFDALNEGRVVFAPRAADAPAPLQPGSGGDGESVILDVNLVPPPGVTELRVLGGDGGDSGVARAGGNDFVLSGTPPVFYSAHHTEGGDGGTAAWDVEHATATLPGDLNSIHVIGGTGGRGISRGGSGGHATYFGRRIATEAPYWATPVVAEGGAGGGVFVSPGETLERGIDEAIAGGRGGDAEAHGHHGWDGSWVKSDGADGGTATARGGDGGDLLPTLPALFAARIRGGDGGDARGEGGRGGNGHPGDCGMLLGPQRGGDGGDGGRAEIRGGDGGDAPEGHGGNGGRMQSAETGAAGFAALGDPAGACGAVTIPAVTGGAGGAGASNGSAGSVGSVVVPPPCPAPQGRIACEDAPSSPDPCGATEWYQLANHTLEVSEAFGETLTFTRSAAKKRCFETFCRWVGEWYQLVDTTPPGGGPSTTIERHQPIDDAYHGVNLANGHCPVGAEKGSPAHQGSGVDVIIHPDPFIVVTTTHQDAGSYTCGGVAPKICCGDPPYQPEDPSHPSCQ
jgi:hypothetical protein